jgi:hypothetical protein
VSGESIRVIHPLFQEGEGGSIPTSPLQLRVEQISFRLARELNREWHSVLPRFGTGFIKLQPFLCYGAQWEDRLYAVAIWSNPCARNLPQKTWLELRRFAIAPDAPKYTASWMLGIMRKLIRKAKPQVQRLLSYQALDRHSGTIYRAAGWTATTVNRDGNWTRVQRPRPKAQESGAKQRWEIAA